MLIPPVRLFEVSAPFRVTSRLPSPFSRIFNPASPPPFRFAFTSSIVVDEVAAAGKVVVFLVVDPFLAVAAGLDEPHVDAEVTRIVLVEVEPFLEVVVRRAEEMVPSDAAFAGFVDVEAVIEVSGIERAVAVTREPNISTRTSPAPRSSTSIPSARIILRLERLNVILRSPLPPSFTRSPSRSENAVEPLWNETRADDRDVDRRIGVAVEIAVAGIILIVHPNTVAIVVDDTDVGQPDMNRARSRNGELRPRSPPPARSAR